MSTSPPRALLRGQSHKTFWSRCSLLKAAVVSRLLRTAGFHEGPGGDGRPMGTCFLVDPAACYRSHSQIKRISTSAPESFSLDQASQAERYAPQDTAAGLVESPSGTLQQQISRQMCCRLAHPPRGACTYTQHSSPSFPDATQESHVLASIVVRRQQLLSHRFLPVPALLEVAVRGEKYCFLRTCWHRISASWRNAALSYSCLDTQAGFHLPVMVCDAFLRL